MLQVAEPERVKLGLRLSQSRPLYEAFKQLKDRHWDELTAAQRRAVDGEIRDFVLGGVALEVRCAADGGLSQCFSAKADDLSQLLPPEL